MATVFELVRSASAMLRASGVDTPEHDAKLLAAEVFGVDLQTVDKAMLMGSETSELAKQGAKQSGEDAALKRFHTMVVAGPSVNRCNISPATRPSATSI